MKKAIVKRLFCVSVLAMMPSVLHAASDGGVIHFQGAIVEGGCGITPQKQAIDISCMKQGKPTSHTVALTQLADYAVQSDSLAHTSIRYLDPQRRLAIVNITYQ